VAVAGDYRQEYTDRNVCATLDNTDRNVCATLDNTDRNVCATLNNTDRNVCYEAITQEKTSFRNNKGVSLLFVLYGTR